MELSEVIRFAYVMWLLNSPQRQYYFNLEPLAQCRVHSVIFRRNCEVNVS